MHALKEKMVALLAAGTLAGCIQQGGENFSGSGRFPSATRAAFLSTNDDYRRTIVEASLVGALIGGAGAAGITAVTGGSGEDILRNGLLGIGGGSLIGMQAGRGIAETKQRYAMREDELNGVIAKARANNASLARMVGTARDIVRERQRQAAAISHTDEAARRELAAAIAADRAAIGKGIDSNGQAIGSLESVRDRLAGSAALDGQISTAQNGREKLSAIDRELKALENKVQ